MTYTHITVTLGSRPSVRGTIAKPTLIVRDTLTDGRTVYVAFAGEAPGCMSHADTPDEAADLLDDARKLHSKRDSTP